MTLQLKWVTQAQFAGYYAAKAKGYYDDENLDVNLKVGGPSITPEQVVLGKQAEFGIDWLPSLLASRDKGQDLVNIAQVFDRSGMTELTWKDSDITTIGKMKGKKVGVWCCGNENELYAALNKNGMDPKKDVTIVNQPFDMNLFLNNQVDAAAAMTYNELAQVLETKNPKTGKLYKPSDLNVIKMDDAGTGDARGRRLRPRRLDQGQDEPGDGEEASWPRASTAGSTAAATSPSARRSCSNNGPTLGKGHQTWMMNEINALVWPAPDGIGVMNKAAYDRTAKIAQQFGVIKKAPSAGRLPHRPRAGRGRRDLTAAGTDVNGSDYKKPAVKVTPKGQ